MNACDRIALAWAALREIDPGYLAATLAQRVELSGEAAGSVYEGVDASELERKLLAADWEPYSHPAVMSGCTAFKAALPGRLGVVDLATLPPDAVVTLDDRKNTGTVSAVVSGVRGEMVDFTVAILGLEGEREIVFTFHPGDPVSPSQVPATGLHGQQVTVSKARGMGLETAKIA